MTLGYLDFEIEIGHPTGREYPITILNSPAGSARVTMPWRFDDLALESRLKDLQIALLSSGRVRRRVLTSAEQAVQRFGAELFELLFAGEVRNRYDVSQEYAHSQNKGLRIKLRIQSPILANLPWEFLHDPRTGEYICLSRQTPLVRYLELPQPIRPLLVKPPLRILGMISNPSDLDRLDVQSEQRQIEQSLASLQADGIVELQWLAGQSWRDLQRAMRRGQWHIFHFVGHGDFDPRRDEGVVALCNTAGKSHHLTASDLGRLLADNQMLRLVVLNACLGAQGSNQDLFSSTAPTLIRHGLPAVVAMQQAITDDAAIEFTQTFYESLADGLPVDAAMSEARKAISIAVTNTLEWGTPVLYSRASDGQLFTMEGHYKHDQGDGLTEHLPKRPHRSLPEVKTEGEPVETSSRINSRDSEDDSTHDKNKANSFIAKQQGIAEAVVQRFEAYWKESFLPTVRKQYGMRVEAALRGVRDIVVFQDRIVLAFGSNEFAHNIIAEPETNNKLVILLSKFLKRSVKLECQLGERVQLHIQNDGTPSLQYTVSTLDARQNGTPAIADKDGKYSSGKLESSIVIEQPLEEVMRQRLNDSWKGLFLPTVRKQHGVRLEAALRGVRDIAISQDCVAFAFGSNDFTRELIAEPETNGKIAALLSQILERSVRLECQPGERAQLVDDPLVQYAISMLGAKLIRRAAI